MKTLIVVLGPTGVGKTELCLSLAEHLSIPIINADSRQIFAELPIGTAAPTAEQQQRVKHYFVCKGIDDIPTVRDDIRTWMKQRLEDEGLEALVEELHKMDPEHWAIVDKKNPRRVVHALEICHQTGKTYTSFRVAEKKQRPFRIIKIGLNRDRTELYDRINQRVLMMMEEGLEAEARSVYPHKGLTALRTVGYKEMFAYFDGEIDKDEAIRQIQSHSREYMRKQLTWFKRDAEIHWYHPDQQDEIIRFIDEEM